MSIDAPEPNNNSSSPYSDDELIEFVTDNLAGAIGRVLDALASEQCDAAGRSALERAGWYTRDKADEARVVDMLRHAGIFPDRERRTVTVNFAPLDPATADRA